jgi:predicted transcriptional regulator
MVKIQEVVQKLRDGKATTQEIADILGVTPSQVAKYRQGAIKYPRIDVAISVYVHTGNVLFPYSKEAIIEIIQDMK